MRMRPTPNKQRFPFESRQRSRRIAGRIARYRLETEGAVSLAGETTASMRYHGGIMSGIALIPTVGATSVRGEGA